MSIYGLIRCVKIVVLAVAISTGLYANPHNPISVPGNIKDSLMSKYADAKEIGWVKQFSTYRADFSHNNRNVSVTFNKRGEIIERAIEISLDSIPGEIIGNLEKNYPAYRSNSAHKILIGSETAYEVEVQKGRTQFILKFDRKGNLANKYMMSRREIGLADDQTFFSTF